MSITAWCVVILQGVSIIGSLLYFGFKAGRLIEKIDGHERRISRIEDRALEEGGKCESDYRNPLPWVDRVSESNRTE